MMGGHRRHRLLDPCRTHDDWRLRLFVAIGKKPDSDTRIHGYVGEFRVDPELRYLTRIAPGEDGVPRQVFVFRLLPVGAVDTTLGETSSIEGAAEVSKVETIAVDEIPVSAIKSEQFEVEVAADVTVVQAEALLAQRYRSYLQQHGRKVLRYSINGIGGRTSEIVARCGQQRLPIVAFD
jgi:5-methylcytosine-specific restriction protein A